MKLMQKCLLSNDQQGTTLLVAKRHPVVQKSMGRCPLFYNLNKHFPYEFMISVASFMP